MVNIGCFWGSGGECSNFAFFETGLTLSQCLQAEKDYSMTCTIDSKCSYSMISDGTMSAKKCLQICTKYGFAYSAIQ